MQLTWAGFEIAVDLIAAQASRHRSGVYGATSIGRILAVAVAYRLQLPVLEEPVYQCLVTEGLGFDDRLIKQHQALDAEIWVWLDQTKDRLYSSVLRTDDKVRIFMPWEEALADHCAERFVTGFHD